MSSTETRYEVVLPESALAIVRAAGGCGPDAKGSLEDALGSILAAMLFVAAEASRVMPEHEYHYFREIVKLQMSDLRTVLYAKDPQAALVKQLNRGRRIRTP